MLDFALSRSSISIPVLYISARLFRVSSCYGNFTSPYLNLKTQSLIPGKARRFLVFAEKDDGLSERNEGDECELEIGFEGENNSGQDQPPIFNIKWNRLLAPDPDNILAIGLTGLLTWASVHVLFQLLFISLAILVGAVKYSIIAALLIFVVITLL